MADAAKIAGVSKSHLYVLAKPIIDKLGYHRSRRSKWSKVNRAEAQKLYEDGWTLAMLGARYGRTREAVRQRINTKVKVRKSPHRRTCYNCGQPYLGLKYTRLCEACKALWTPYDRCKCGRRKHKTSNRCFFCATRELRKFPRDAAASLYQTGYGLNDIAGVFGVHPRAVHRALTRSGIVMRSKGEGLIAARHARETRPVLVALRELARESPQPNALEHRAKKENAKRERS